MLRPGQFIVVNAGGIHKPTPESSGFRPMTLPPLADEPLASVLIPCRDREDYVGAAIDSVLDQSYQRVEVVVCDDGSQDASADVVSDRAARDSRVRLLRSPPLGMCPATNAAFRASTGSVVLLLDSDDLYEPERVAEAIATFRTNPQAGLSFQPTLVVAPDGVEVVGRWPLVTEVPVGWRGPDLVGEELRFPGFALTSSLALRREVAERIFPLPDLKSGQDAFVAMTSLLITEVARGHRELVRYRTHSEQQSGIAAFPPTNDLRRLEILGALIRTADEWAQRQLPAGVRLAPLETSLDYAQAHMVMAKIEGSRRSALRWSAAAARTSAFAELPLLRRAYMRAYPLMPMGLLRATAVGGSLYRRAARLRSVLG